MRSVEPQDMETPVLYERVLFQIGHPQWTASVDHVIFRDDLSYSLVFECR
jgi:hypothetical protein